MVRVLSALVLLPIVVGVIWFLSPVATLAVAAVVLALALREYVALTRRLGVMTPATLTWAATLGTWSAVSWTRAPLDIVLMASTIAIAVAALTTGRRGADALLDVSGALFAALYLALPLGVLVRLRLDPGREALLLLLLTVMASDVAQYYGGRAMGRRALAPAISPKKTVEGAIAGLAAGAVVMVGVGRWWLSGAGTPGLLLVGATLVALGIAGDLFESLLKRSAGVKDASGLIPGHGGMLDRIDSLLFAAPVYYAFVTFGVRS